MSSIIIPFGGAIVNGGAYIVPVWDLNRSHNPWPGFAIVALPSTLWLFNITVENQYF